MAASDSKMLVVDMLGGALGTLTPPRHTPKDYGARLSAAGIHAIVVTLGLYARDIRSVLKDFYDYFCLFEDVPERLMQIRRADDLLVARDSGKLGVILGLQGLHFIEEETSFISILARLGLRVAALTYNERTQFGGGCLEPQDEGLTLIGKRAVRELDRCGVLIDLSHAGFRTSLDIVGLSAHPVVATHSNARAITPNGRNLEDEQIRAIADKGGFVGISPYSPFCSKPGKPRPDLDDYLDHIEYVAGLVGAEHVAIGTDFFPHSKVRWENTTRRMYPEMVGDYVFETLYAEGIEDHPDFPAIPDGLARRGFGEADIAAILGGNALRVVREVWPER